MYECEMCVGVQVPQYASADTNQVWQTAWVKGGLVIADWWLKSSLSTGLRWYYSKEGHLIMLGRGRSPGFLIISTDAVEGEGLWLSDGDGL